MNEMIKEFTDSPQWFALYCKSRHESQVDLRLKSKGVQTFLAAFETRVLWGTRWRKVRKNLLPGYLLINEKMTPAKYLTILQTPGVVKFVGKPWPDLSKIPEEQVQSLQLLLGSKEHFHEVPYLKHGDDVEVIGGPLQGLKGRVLSEHYPQNRVIVSLDLLQRSVAVQVDAHLLKKIDNKALCLFE